MKCYFLMGLPGSGKSFLTDKILIKNPNVVILSMDSIIDKYAKEHNMSYREVWKNYIKVAEVEFTNTLNEALKNKKEIIWDQTNLHKNSRSPKIKKLLENSYEIEGLTLELSEKEWFSRIKKRESEGGKTMPLPVLEEMSKSYQTPEYSEGFHKIYVVNDNNEIISKFNQKSIKNNITSIRVNSEIYEINPFLLKCNK